MKFQILTLFPDFFQSCLQVGLLGRSIKNSLLDIELIDIKKFANKGRADDSPFGGGDGMLLSYPSLEKSIQSIPSVGRVIYLSAQGKSWSASKAKEYSKKYQNITLLCGRYEGVDARFIKDYVDEEISIGDYILNGGETATLVFIESLSRFLEGFLGNKESSQEESFENFLLEGPRWTRPREIKDHMIPSLIFSGNHEEIKKLRFFTSLLLTKLKRPDLLEGKKELLSQIPLAESFLSSFNDKELEALGLCKSKSVFTLK